MIGHHALQMTDDVLNAEDLTMASGLTQQPFGLFARRKAAGAKRLVGGLERQLESLCRQIGGTGWEEWLKSIHDWLTNTPDQGLFKGFAALCRLIEEIKVLASQIEAWKRDLARHRQLGTEPVQRPEKRIEEATEKARKRLKEFVDEFATPADGP